MKTARVSLILIGLVLSQVSGVALEGEKPAASTGERLGSGGSFVRVYLEENYKGRAYRLPVPSALADDKALARAGIPNDAIQSLRVPRGTVVTLCDHKAFGGTRQTFAADAATLGTMKSLASSVRVETGSSAGVDHLPPAAPIAKTGERHPRTYVQVYLEENFRGRPYSVEIPAALGNGAQLKMLGIPDDSIRSIRAPEGVVVTIYEHSAFTGARQTLTGEAQSVGDLRGRVSGLKADFAPGSKSSGE